MLESVLIIKDALNLYAAIESESKDLVSKRARVDFNLNDSNLVISIKADDFTSFRAMESSVMRLLVTYYKIKGID